MLNPSAIYCIANIKREPLAFDKKFNLDDQTLFVRLLSLADFQCDKSHLAKHGSLNSPDMFLLICLGYIHVILFVGKL